MTVSLFSLKFTTLRLKYTNKEFQSPQYSPSRARFRRFTHCIAAFLESRTSPKNRPSIVLPSTEKGMESGIPENPSFSWS